jgi:hypothetical protein
MLAAAVLVTGLRFNTWTGSGSDGFAYVSQAALFRAGRLELPLPLARRAPWPDATATFAPFGYRAAPGGGAAAVPITSPGLPLLMATGQAIAGHGAAFVISPLAGAGLVWATFVIGCQARSRRAGLIAAWLAATSPALLFMVLWPMTDAPAGLWAALMIALLLGATSLRAGLAGLAGAAGVLTRPNFVIITAAAGVWMLVRAGRSSDRHRWRHLLAFAAGVLPGAVVLVGLNQHWYGSPVASGYGTAGQLLQVSRFGPNVVRYAAWLTDTSPLAWLGVAALLFPTGALWRRYPEARWLLGVTAAAALSIYLFYVPFDDWWYLRFLLPAWPALFVGAGVLLDALAGRGRPWAALVLCALLLAGIHGVRLARHRGVFRLGEDRYVHVARLVDQFTEPGAVILTWQHCGTVRYYGGRETLRFELLDPAWLDRAVDWLHARGRHPYVLLEDWERPIFEARFRSANALGTLAFPPVFEWHSSIDAGVVWLFDPYRRDAVTAHPGSGVERTTPRPAEPIAFPEVK